MDTNTVVLLGMMSRLLRQFLELSNRISEDDMRELAMKIKQQPKRTKAMKDGIELGNLFLLAFFLKELVESLPEEKVKYIN